MTHLAKVREHALVVGRYSRAIGTARPISSSVGRDADAGPGAQRCDGR